MKMRMGGVVCVVMLAAGMAAGQSDQDTAWVGTWHAELDGQPSAVLTLAKDNGALEGTLVLNGISRDGGQPHIAVREAHALMHPRLEGQTLSFQVKRRDASSPLMNFTVDLTAHGSARLRCLNCGEDAPVVEMSKEN
jgi:hypothetical protein